MTGLVCARLTEAGNVAGRAGVGYRFMHVFQEIEFSINTKRYTKKNYGYERQQDPGLGSKEMQMECIKNCENICPFFVLWYCEKKS